MHREGQRLHLPSLEQVLLLDRGEGRAQNLQWQVVRHYPESLSPRGGLTAEQLGLVQPLAIWDRASMRRTAGAPAASGAGGIVSAGMSWP